MPPPADEHEHGEQQETAHAGRDEARPAPDQRVDHRRDSVQKQVTDDERADDGWPTRRGLRGSSAPLSGIEIELCHGRHPSVPTLSGKLST